jgi:two-component system, cell cycle sensor histidine kinase and response regulator CckA
MMGFVGGLKRIAARLAGLCLAVVPAILCGGPVAAQSVTANSGPDTTLQLGIVVLAVALVAALAWGLVCRRRSRMLRELFDSLPSPRLVVDSSGNPVAVTTSWRKLLGEAENSLGVLAEIAAKDGADGRDRFDRLVAAARNRQPAHAEFRVDLPEMEYAEISVMELETGADLMFWRLEDVSERYELERVIRTEQEKLIEFVENAPIGFYSVDREGRFIYVNATFAGWFGKTETDLTNGNVRLRDLLPDHLVKTCSAHSPLAEQDGDAVGETHFVGHRGETFDAYITQTVVVDESNGDLRTRTLVRHLSGERNFAEAVRISQERFQRFFFDAPVGIVLLDPEAHVTECNQAFENTNGLGAAQSVGKAFADFIYPEDADKFGRWVTAAYDADEPPTPIEVRLGERGGGDGIALCGARGKR